MTSSSFPLFHNLYNETANENLLNYEHQMELCQKIKEMDDEGCEIIFAIIKFYYISIDNGFIDHLPYKPKINKNGYKYELNNLPIKLINMIEKFVNLHNNKIELDKHRNITN